MTRVVVKRNNPWLIDVYGHWWVEIDGVESYGWWPATRPVSIPKALRGVAGALNGVGGAGGPSPTVDPRHGDPADHAFHPAPAAPSSPRPAGGTASWPASGSSLTVAGAPSVDRRSRSWP
ncbi:MAG: hypothetical protein ABIY58_01330 [Acidimicrobiales bacterium]